jgi:hypothetical protein
MLTHKLACLLEKYGCESERATEVAFAHTCWALHVAGCWGQVCRAAGSKALATRDAAD